MEGKAAAEFHDWELLHNSSNADSVISSDSVASLRDFEGESQGMIHADYFSIDYRNNCSKVAACDQGFIESGNMSWVGSELEGRIAGKEPREVWPDSGSSRFVDCKFGEFEGKDELGFVGNGETLLGFEGIGEVNSPKNELGFVGNEKTLVGFEGIGEMNSPKNELGFVGNGKTLVGFEGIGEMNSPENELGFVGNEKTLLGFEEIGEVGFQDKFSLSKNEPGFVGNGEKEAGCDVIGLRLLEFSEIGHDSDVGRGIDASSDIGEDISAGENDGILSGEQNTPPMEEVKTGVDRERKSVEWWKVPLELLKFCAFRISPVWTFSTAAAFLGVVILTRRLYMMKKRSRALQLKATMNDKKVSQFMSGTARLNEAFSMVKRVPVIRPALPGPSGLTQWPVMSLR